MIEPRRERRVDCRRDACKDDEGVLHNRIADQKTRRREGDERNDEEAQEDHVERQVDEVACAVDVDERADRQHGEPCGDVDDVGKCIGEDSRASNAARVQQNPCRHAEDAELIP